MVPRKPKTDKLDDALETNTDHQSSAADFTPAEKIEPAEQAVDLSAQLAELEQQITELTSKNEELNQKLLRCHAERENERTRMQRDMRNARSYALSDFAKALVTVADHLERGLENTDTEDPAQQSFAEGLQLTYDSLLKVFADHHIEQLNPLGEAFDPDFHEAVSSQPVPEGSKPDTVLAVVQRGYLIKDRLVRPALVMVAK